MTKNINFFIYSMILVIPTAHGSQERILRNLAGTLSTIAGSLIFDYTALTSITDARKTKIGRAENLANFVLSPAALVLRGVGYTTLKTDDRSEQSSWIAWSSVALSSATVIRLIKSAVEFDKTKPLSDQFAALVLNGSLLIRSLLEYKQHTAKKTTPQDKLQEKKDEGIAPLKNKELSTAS